MKITITSRTRAVITALLVGGFALWFYLRPYPWLGVAMALLSGLFTYLVIATHHQERYRRAFSIGVFCFTFVAFLAIIGTDFSYTHNFATQHLNYIQYYYPFESFGGISFPCNRLISQLFIGQVEYTPGRELWMGILPTTAGKLLIAFVSFIAIGIFFGRSFCAWICPFGGLNEALSSSKKERWTLDILRVEKVASSGQRFHNLKSWVKDTKYALLAAVILMSIPLAFPVACALCPLLWFSSWPVFWVVMLLVAGFAIVLPFLNRRRWWCQICPFGALLSLLDKVSFFRVRINQNNCIKCLKCAHECSMFALTPKGIEGKGTPDADCIRCHRCAEVCPTQAIDLYWFNTSRKAQGVLIPLSIIVVLVWLSWFVLIMVDKVFG